MPRVLALDLSTKTGWAVFDDGVYITSGGTEKVFVDDFNVNAEPNRSPKYPFNIIDAAAEVAAQALALLDEHAPDRVVIENTVKGRNRNTQRCLEFIHSAVLIALRPRVALSYMDPSEWRKVVDMRLSAEQKKNNRDVSAGKKRGRIGKKHLSVNMVNEKYNLGLKLKDNDRADAILLGLGFCIAQQKVTAT